VVEVNKVRAIIEGFRDKYAGLKSGGVPSGLARLAQLMEKS